MLDNLLDIEIAYNLLKSTEDSDRDPIDLHYEKLRTRIDVSNCILTANLLLLLC